MRKILNKYKFFYFYVLLSSLNIYKDSKRKMSSKVLSVIALSAAVSTLSPLPVKSEGGCSNYPFVPMETKFVPREDGKFSLQMTMDQSVRADDNNLRMRAQKIALMRGKKAISDFVKENIAGKDNFDSSFLEESVTGKEGVDWKAEDATELLENISTSSDNVISGILPLASCYEPGKYVRVTVGIKPETIEAAGRTAATSKGPFQGYKAETPNPSGSENIEETNSLSPYNTVGGYGVDKIDF